MFLQGPHGRLVDVGHVLHADVACRFSSECVDKKKELKRKRKISKRKEEDRVNGCALGPPTASGLALSWSRFSHRSEHTKTVIGRRLRRPRAAHRASLVLEHEDELFRFTTPGIAGSRSGLVPGREWSDFSPNPVDPR